MRNFFMIFYITWNFGIQPKFQVRSQDNTRVRFMRYTRTIALAPVANGKTRLAEQLVAESLVQDERMECRGAGFGNSARCFNVVNGECVDREDIAMWFIAGRRARAAVVAVGDRCAGIDEIVGTAERRRGQRGGGVP